MIKPKLYCIEAEYTLDDEAYSFHTVSVDMDEETAIVLAAKELDLNKEDINVLAFYEVMVDGFNIIVEEKE